MTSQLQKWQAKHSECESRISSSTAEISQLWDNVFQKVYENVSTIVERSVSDILNTLRTEEETIKRRLRMECDRMHSMRQISPMPTPPADSSIKERTFPVYDDGERENQIRRRSQTETAVCAERPLSNASTSSSYGQPTPTALGVGDLMKLLTEMKTTMTQQTHELARLRQGQDRIYQSVCPLYLYSL